MQLTGGGVRSGLFMCDVKEKNDWAEKETRTGSTGVTITIDYLKGS